MSREILLKDGLAAIIDDEDYEAVSAHRWHITAERGHSTRYAITIIRLGGQRRTVQMHRLITGAGAGIVVDHINGNGLDNRRENLRFCTHQENTRNRKRSKTNTSGYRGVSLTRNGRWRAGLVVGDKQIHIGNFRCIVQAARAYDEAAIEHFGEFARLNFDPGRDWLFPHDYAADAWPSPIAQPSYRGGRCQ